ncbi:MAG: DUF4867 family protein [Clostridiales bacterium]|nr:DUF4867 family protein [Clostridiales bacterium]
MKIYSINDERFAKYGRVLENPFFNDLCEQSKNIEIPETGCSYLASVEAFETPKALEYFSQYFGQMPIQMGYCWGRNSLLNAIEWHKTSEVHCALEDMVVLLGYFGDIKNNEYDSSKIEAFLVEKGQAIEVYETTLHFCPVKANGGVFKNVVILPKGTNTPLEKPNSDKLLVAKNKWLLAHPECKKQVDLGRIAGIKGKNLNIDEF